MHGFQKIHFINRVDYKNTGDYICSPLVYYWDFFKNYAFVRHDIGAVDFNTIKQNDVVIIGASGMLNVSDIYNLNIERVLSACETVIGWSIGFNSHNGFIPNRSIMTSLHHFKLIGIRDYQHQSGLRYLPCVTAKLPELEKSLPLKRTLGAINHKDFPIAHAKVETISNSASIEEITDFIASSETILTSSYHIVYFCQLMGKKAVLLNAFSEKFEHFKYQPLRGLENINTNHPISNNHFLQECRKLNDEFFEEVQAIINATIKHSDPSLTIFYATQSTASLACQACICRDQIYDLENSGLIRIYKKFLSIESLPLLGYPFRLFKKIIKFILGKY